MMKGPGAALTSPSSRPLPKAVRKSSLTPQSSKTGLRTRSKRPVGSLATSVAPEDVVTTSDDDQGALQAETVKTLSNIGKMAARKRFDVRKRYRSMEGDMEGGGGGTKPQLLAGRGSAMGRMGELSKEEGWKGFADEEGGCSAERKGEGGLLSVENDWCLGALDDMVLDSPPSTHSGEDPFATYMDSPLTLHTPPSLPSLDGTEDSEDSGTGETASVTESTTEEIQEPRVGAELCPDRRAAMLAFLQAEARRGFPRGMLELQLRGAEVWGPHSAPCARQACARAARWASKYCSNACGLLVAQDRLLLALKLQMAQEEGWLIPVPTEPPPLAPTPPSTSTFHAIPRSAEPQLQLLEAHWRLVQRRARHSLHAPTQALHPRERPEGQGGSRDRRGSEDLAALRAAFQAWRGGVTSFDLRGQLARRPVQRGAVRPVGVLVSCHGCGAQVAADRLATHGRLQCSVRAGGQGTQAWPWRPEAGEEQQEEEDQGEWDELADVVVTSELVHGTVWAEGGELGWLNLGTQPHPRQDAGMPDARPPLVGREAGALSGERGAVSRASGLAGGGRREPEALGVDPRADLPPAPPPAKAAAAVVFQGLEQAMGPREGDRRGQEGVEDRLPQQQETLGVRGGEEADMAKGFTKGVGAEKFRAKEGEGGSAWRATLGALRLETIRQGWMIIAENARADRERGPETKEIDAVHDAAPCGANC